MEGGSGAPGFFCPASSSSPFIPGDVSRGAATPPAAPDPTTTASYVRDRSTSCSCEALNRISVIAPSLLSRSPSDQNSRPCRYSKFARASARSLAGSFANFEYLRSEEHTSELQSQSNLVCRLLLEKKK